MSRAQAIADAEEMRQTHVDWLGHLRLGRNGEPYCRPCAEAGMERIVGDAAHHEDCIDKYDRILAALRQPNPKHPRSAKKKKRESPSARIERRRALYELDDFVNALLSPMVEAAALREKRRQETRTNWKENDPSRNDPSSMQAVLATAVNAAFEVMAGRSL